VSEVRSECRPIEEHHEEARPRLSPGSRRGNRQIEDADLTGDAPGTGHRAMHDPRTTSPVTAGNHDPAEELVNPDGMEAYLREFLAVLQETAEANLPPGYPPQLLQLSFLPAEVVGYVSSVRGAGFEFRPAPTTSFHVAYVHRRVEEAFMAAPRWAISDPTNLFTLEDSHQIVFTGWKAQNFAGFALEGDSDVILCEMQFSGPGWNRYVQYAELTTDRRAKTWSVEAATERALRQVLAASVQLRAAFTLQIGPAAFSSAYKEKMVLLLGSYHEGGEERLRAIARCLEKQGFAPMIVKDVATLPGMTWETKVIWLASLARFVMFDDTTLSGHDVEMRIAKEHDWVTAVLRGRGRATTAMVEQISSFRKYWQEFDYNVDDPFSGVAEAVDWADENVHNLAALYPSGAVWRPVVTE
jgi:hypothetical protein